LISAFAILGVWINFSLCYTTVVVQKNQGVEAGVGATENGGAAKRKSMLIRHEGYINTMREPISLQHMASESACMHESILS